MGAASREATQTVREQLIAGAAIIFLSDVEITLLV
jgi:hypothetical protein